MSAARRLASPDELARRSAAELREQHGHAEPEDASAQSIRAAFTDDSSAKLGLDHSSHAGVSMGSSTESLMSGPSRDRARAGSKSKAIAERKKPLLTKCKNGHAQTIDVEVCMVSGCGAVILRAVCDANHAQDEHHKKCAMILADGKHCGLPVRRLRKSNAGRKPLENPKTRGNVSARVSTLTHPDWSTANGGEVVDDAAKYNLLAKDVADLRRGYAKLADKARRAGGLVGAFEYLKAFEDFIDLKIADVDAA